MKAEEDLEIVEKECKTLRRKVNIYGTLLAVIIATLVLPVLLINGICYVLYKLSDFLYTRSGSILKRCSNFWGSRVYPITKLQKKVEKMIKDVQILRSKKEELKDKVWRERNK